MEEPSLRLGIAKDASPDEIKAAYKTLLRQSNQMVAAGGNAGGKWRTRVEDAYNTVLLSASPNKDEDS